MRRPWPIRGCCDIGRRIYDINGHMFDLKKHEYCPSMQSEKKDDVRDSFCSTQSFIKAALYVVLTHFSFQIWLVKFSSGKLGASHNNEDSDS
jgi:hypothetical protein